MKRIVTMNLLLACCMLAAQAQNTIESIRKAYQEQKEFIALMNDNFPSEGIPPEYYHLHVMQNLPGTGGHQEHVWMYYGELPAEEEGDPYPPHYLSFVSSKYNFAAREYYEEYLYDSQGRVMFIYVRTPAVDLTSMYEFRLYFDGKRLLRLNVKESKGEAFDDETAISFKDVYTGNKITEQYSEYCSQYIASARKFLEMFKAIDGNTYL